MIVKKVTPQVWKGLAEAAHVAVFDESWDAKLETIDFALLMVSRDSDRIISYATFQKLDSMEVYIQYGGAFPIYLGTPMVFTSFRKMLETLKLEYRKISTLVENNNLVMLKFYMKEGFLTTGIRYFKDLILLKQTYEN